MKDLSVAIATFNEEKNIGNCLEAIRRIADEIVVVDGRSSDKTAEIAKSFGARVIVTDNHPIFHINKQKAIDTSSGRWILQLDADEIVSQKLADEISRVIKMGDPELERYQESLAHKKLFLKHQKLIEDREGVLGTQAGSYSAFFIPRANYFLGKYLRYGGVYPDGVIRLIKNGKAYLPCKDVHEQMVVEGRVGWLQHDLIHMADPTFKRYLERNSRYIDLIVSKLTKEKVGMNLKSLLDFMVIKPLLWFLLTFIKHKGILDGYQGFIFSFFSALRFPRAYIRYLNQKCPSSKLYR